MEQIIEKNGVITYTKQFKIKAKGGRRKYIINQWLKEGNFALLEQYMKTLNGVRDRYFPIPRYKKHGESPDNTPNKYLNLYNASLDVSIRKRPMEFKSGQWIAVEVECFIPKDTISGEYSDMFDNGSSNSYEYKLRKVFREYKLQNVEVKGDGSIGNFDEDEYESFECTVFFTKNNPKPLKELLNVLNSLEAQVNTTCGLHIHLDQRDLLKTGKMLEIKRRGKRIGNALNVLSKMVPKSRRNNTYCNLSVSKIRGDRYCAVNMTAVRKFGTIEVRLHSGTTNYEKITNWIDLIWTISRCKKMGNNVANTIEELVELTKLSDKQIGYVYDRTKICSPEIFDVPVMGGDSEDCNNQPAVPF